MINTLMYTKKLEEVGLSREQAEAHIEIMADIIQTDLATKQDMKNLGAELRGEMKDLSTDLRGEMKALSTELRGEMKDLRLELQHSMQMLEKNLVIKLGGIVTVVAGVTMAIAKFL